MSESREPDDREAKRRKSLDPQQERPPENPSDSKEAEKTGAQNPLEEVSKGENPTEAEEENPEIKNPETEVKAETEAIHPEIGLHEVEVSSVDTKGLEKVIRKGKRVPLILPFKKRDGSWFISSPKMAEKKTAREQEDEDLKRAIQLSKESFMLESMGMGSSAAQGIPNPSTGETSAAPPITGDMDVGPESGRDSAAEVDESNTHDSPPLSPRGILLFEMQITRSNWLVIREKAAAAFFPSVPAYCESNMEEEITITDCNKDEWTMTLVNYIEEKVYLIAKGWTNFAEWHNVEPSDVIAFYMPVDILAEKHYRVEFARLGHYVVTISEFARGNFLFDLELQLADIGDRRLFMPRTEVETHFPAIKMVPGTGSTKQIVRFTDVGSKDWYMEITLYNDVLYMITEGWADFVKEHKLEAQDRIMFYEPAQPSHTKHFLIEFVRKEGVSSPSPQAPGSSASYEKGDPSRRSRLGKEKVFDF